MQSNGCASQEITASARRLEIPCQVIVEMEMTDKNSLAIAEYKPSNALYLSSIKSQ